MENMKEEYVHAKKNVVKDITAMKQKLTENYANKDKDELLKDYAVALYLLISLEKIDEYSMLMGFVEDKKI